MTKLPRFARTDNTTEQLDRSHDHEVADRARPQQRDRLALFPDDDTTHPDVETHRSPPRRGEDKRSPGRKHKRKNRRITVPLLPASTRKITAERTAALLSAGKRISPAGSTVARLLAGKRISTAGRIVAHQTAGKRRCPAAAARTVTAHVPTRGMQAPSVTKIEVTRGKKNKDTTGILEGTHQNALDLPRTPSSSTCTTTTSSATVA